MKKRLHIYAVCQPYVWGYFVHVEAESEQKARKCAGFLLEEAKEQQKRLLAYRLTGKNLRILKRSEWVRTHLKAAKRRRAK
jgi:hypothetical protein